MPLFLLLTAMIRRRPFPPLWSICHTCSREAVKPQENLVLAKMELFNVVLHEDHENSTLQSPRIFICRTILLIFEQDRSSSQDLKHACLLVFANKQE